MSGNSRPNVAGVVAENGEFGHQHTLSSSIAGLAVTKQRGGKER